MAEKVQTITEIRHHLITMFAGEWPDGEARALASLIIEEYTGMGGARQITFGNQTPDSGIMTRIFSTAERVLSGEPLQYVLGYTLFCGHRMEVSPAVLIPRPETEEMTTMIISENSGFSGTALDLCTGSGCIAISVSCDFPEATVFATDYSEAALSVARRNAELNRAKVIFSLSDILLAENNSLPLCNLIFSNPPYVREVEKPFMHRNVLDHEPHEALFVPEDDPLIFYRRIAEISGHRLLKGGLLYLEINESLGKETASLFAAPPFTGVSIIKDIRGKERFLKVERYE